MKTVLLHGFDHIGKDELRRESVQVFSVEVPVTVTFLELVERLGVPAREVAVDETDLSVGTILFAEQVERPGGNVFRRECRIDLGKLAERSDVRGILAGRPVEYFVVRELTNFGDDLETLFLRIERRNERLEREETAERGVFFYVKADHQCVVKLVQLIRVRTHYGGGR